MPEKSGVAEKWIPAFVGMTMLVLRLGRVPD
jgi:hypothetical protein